MGIVAEKVQAALSAAIRNWITAVYAALAAADDGQVLTADGAGGSDWETPTAGMPLVNPATAGNLVTLATGGTLTDAGYAADPAATPGSVVRRGSSGEGQFAINSPGPSVQSAITATAAGATGRAISLLVDEKAIFIEATQDDAIAIEGWRGSEKRFDIEVDDGVHRFYGLSADDNRDAQRTEIGAAASSDLTAHTSATGAGVHGAGATGAALLATATQTDARTALGLGTAATSDANDFDAAGSAAAAQAAAIASSLQRASNLSDLASAATAFANIKQAATDSASGVVELATVAEALAGRDTSRATTAAGVLYARAETDRMESAKRALIDLVESFTARLPKRPLTLEYSTASLYYVWQWQRGREWLRWNLNKTANNVWFLNNAAAYYVTEAVNDTDAGITYDASVAAWLTNTVASNVGGSCHYAYLANQWMQFTITGYTDLWIAYNKYSTGGYVVPTVNGSQTLVDKRSLTWEPTAGEWVWNTYGASATYKNWIRIADGLDPATTYTIRLRTSNTTALPGGNRFYFEAYGRSATRYDAPGVQSVTNTVVARGVTPIENDGSYVVDIKPTGASVFQLSGGTHGNQVVASAATVTDEDGNNVAPSSGVLVTVPTFTIMQNLYARHSQTGTTNVASVKDAIHFTSDRIRQHVKLTWLVQTEISRLFHGYTRTEGNYGVIAGDPTIYDMTGGSVGTRYGAQKSLASLQWSASHDYVILSALDSAAQGFSWQYSGAIYFEKFSTGAKVYPQPVAETITAAVNDVWQLSHQYIPAIVANVEDYL